MGKNSGGVRGSFTYSEGGGNAYSRAIDRIENAINTKSKEGLAKAKAQMKKLVEKMPDNIVFERANSFSYAQRVTQKRNSIPSEYSATRHKYHFEMSKIYNSEANKRRRKGNK